MSTAIETMTATALVRKLRGEKWRRAKRYWLLYAIMLFPVVQLIIFHYIPIYGIVIAFKEYRLDMGFLRSPWNDFAHFKRMFASVYFGRIIRNTLIISFYRIAFGFPAPIVLALLINEVQNMRFKKIVQSISYRPHFMSWVVLASIIVEILSPTRGIVGWIYALFGKEAPLLLTSQRAFRPLLIVTGVWQGVGWGTVVYLAALSGIDPELYESAAVDGANRFRMAIHITVPSLVPVMIVLFILRLGHILSAGFDQIYNLYNPLVYEVADILDTYIYRVGLFGRQYAFGTAVGLLKSGIGVILIVGTNAIIRRFSEYGIW